MIMKITVCRACVKQCQN